MNIGARIMVLVCFVALVGCGQTQTTVTPAAPPAAQPSVTPAHAPENNQPPAGGIQSHGGPVKDHVSLVDFLRSQGITVAIGDPVQQPFLRGEGTTLQLSGGTLTQPATVQSYNYDDTDLGGTAVATATEDMAGIQPDGSPATTQVTWIDPPHWFHQERVIVLYLGSDPAALTLLTTALGQQVAGR